MLDPMFSERIKCRKKIRIILVLIFAFGTLCEGAQKTKCDKPWRTFRNVCFLFSDTNNQRFDEAQKVCYKQGGFLASVRNSAEHGFIIKTIQGMGSSYQRVRWFIGLYQYDPEDNKKYRWVDGSVSAFRNWMPTQPNSVYERCGMLDGSNGFKWRDDVCTNRALFICRKDLDDKGSMSCFKGKPPPHQILQKKGISVTECLEHCRGLGFPLAGVIPHKCYCIEDNNLDKMSLASRLACSGNCGNQHCGNKDYVTIYNLTFYNDKAESCEDLMQLGFSTPSVYITKNGDDEKLTNCFTSNDTRYTATTSFHLPDLNSAGTPVHSDGPVHSSENGPEGFGNAADFGENDQKPERSCLKVNDLSGSARGKASEEQMKCWRNPLNCKHGFSASIFAQLVFDRRDESTRYLFSTGGDIKGTPGVAVYYKGLYLHAVVSTGVDVWSIYVAGLVLNDTWSNVAFTWDMKDGLDLYINAKRQAFVKYPDPVPPPPRQPMKPLQLTIGCRRLGKNNYDDYVKGKLDEFATWQYKVSADNASFFLGGMEPDKLCNPPKHPMKCSTDIKKLLEQLDTMDLSNLDTAMTTIQHISEVTKAATTKKPRNGQTGGKSGRGGSKTVDQKDKTEVGPQNTETEDYDEDEDDVDLDKIRKGNLKTIIEIVKKLVNKTTGPFSPGVEPEDLSVLYKMQEMTSIIFSEGQADLWKEIQQDGDDAIALTRAIQDWTMSKLLESKTKDKNVDLLMISDNVATQSVKSNPLELRTKYGPYIYFPDYAKDPKWQELRKKWNGASDQVRIPTAALGNSEEPISIQSNYYSAFHKMAPIHNTIVSSNTSKVFIDSRVITFDVKPTYNKDILTNDPVIIFLEHDWQKSKGQHRGSAELEEPKIEYWACVRWSDTLEIPERTKLGGWTEEGCTQVNSTESYTTCACDSLGMFALLAIPPTPKIYIEPPDEPWLFAVRGLGYSLSIIALICYISAIALRPSLHDQFHIIRLNLSIAAICTMLAFFSVDYKRHDAKVCRILSGFIHYFYLAVGFWMALLTHALFRGFIKGVVDGRIIFYVLIGWGIPLIWVGIVVASSPNYGEDDRCMIGPTRIMRCSLACPLALISMCSFAWSTVICCNLTSPQIKRIEVVQELNQSTKMLFFLSMAFTGIWIPGVVTWLELDPVNRRGWRKLFQIFNSFMGVYIVFLLGFGSGHFRYAVLDKYLKYLHVLFHSNEVNPTPFEYTNGYRFEYKNYYY